jgi:hypothetical protein
VTGMVWENNVILTHPSILTPELSTKASQNQGSRRKIFSDNSRKSDYLAKNYIYSGRGNFSTSSYGQNSVLFFSKNLSFKGGGP